MELVYTFIQILILSLCSACLALFVDFATNKGNILDFVTLWIAYKVVKKYSKIKYDYALTIPDKNEANTFIIETATNYKLFKLFTCVNCFGTWICIGLVIWAVLLFGLNWFILLPCIGLNFFFINVFIRILDND